MAEGDLSSSVALGIYPRQLQTREVVLLFLKAGTPFQHREIFFFEHLALVRKMYV